VADHPDHCRSGPLESPHQSVEPGCGFVEAFEHVDLAVLADKRDGESVAVRMKADAPGQDGVGGGSSVASCFSTPDLTSIETSR
jgi:hypothetical protein